MPHRGCCAQPADDRGKPDGGAHARGARLARHVISFCPGFRPVARGEPGFRHAHEQRFVVRVLGLLRESHAFARVAAILVTRGHFPSETRRLPSGNPPAPNRPRNASAGFWFRHGSQFSLELW